MFVLMIAALVSGFLLAAAHRWRTCTVLLLVALIPFLTAFVVVQLGAGSGALAGVALGCAYAVPLAVHLRFPPMLAIGLSVYLASGFVVLGVGAALAFAHLPPLIAAVMSALCAVICDRLTVILVPAWGTAQSWVRPLSRWPWLVRAAGSAGQTAVLFFIALPQVLAAVVLTQRPEATDAALAAIVIMVVSAALCALAISHRKPRTLRVAASRLMKQSC